MSETINRPKCPGCEEPMIFSFCVKYKEYVCIPCGTAEEFLCDKQAETTQEAEDKLKEKYKNDIQRLSFLHGGATCGNCNNSGGNNCKKCKVPEEFEYWDKGEG